MQPDRGTRAVVNLDAIVNNIKAAKRNLNVGTKLCAVVKANAYGHGAIPVAIACIEAGVDYFAVALVQEAVELREAGITKPILVLGAMPVRPSMADLCVRFNIAHAVFDEERLTLLNEAGLRRGKKAKIHIALETGMHRIGIKIDEAAAFAAKVKAMQGIEVVGAFSHFSAADVEDKSYADCRLWKLRDCRFPSNISPTARPLRNCPNTSWTWCVWASPCTVRGRQILQNRTRTTVRL